MLCIYIYIYVYMYNVLELHTFSLFLLHLTSPGSYSLGEGYLRLYVFPAVIIRSTWEESRVLQFDG